MKKRPVIAVVGPTASGKTALAVDIALRYNGEVVSADSMQIYKGMDIATAKPMQDEMMGIRHHLIDFVDPSEKYCVARYVQDARAAIDDIHKRGKLPVICGGTGLYIDSLLGNIQFEDEPDNSAVREELQLRMETEGAEVLLSELKDVDPVLAEQLHPNNKGRIIRALEVYKLTGETATERRLRSRTKPCMYDCFYIAIAFPDRDFLYDRINRRVDIMLTEGLEEEARNFFSLHTDTAAQAIGYKELKGWFDGEISREEAIENLKRETRRYAKRQITWFRRNDAIHYINRCPTDTAADISNAAFEMIDNSNFLKGA